MFGSCVGTTTTISGTVVAGTDSTQGFGNPDPVYNAVVYIPTGSPQPFASKVSCDQCGADITGDPLILQRTGIDGKFTLSGVPCGTGINLPIVIQLGRWRRQINLADVQCCMPTMLTTAQTHLPRNQTEGDLPRIAVSTGDVDALECVLRKMGMDQAEFTKPDGAGRVHLYHGNGAVGGKNSSQEDDLVTNVTELEKYDMVLFPCWGGQNNKPLTSQQNLIKYGDEGGRVFATHFSYTWLASVGGVGSEMDGAPTGTPPEPAPWVSTATFNVNEANYDNTGMTGIIDQSFPKGAALAQWLQGIGASTTMGQIPISYIRRDTDAMVAPSQR